MKVKKKLIVFIFSSLSLYTLLFSSCLVKATDTSGNVGFYGIYIPDGYPQNPAPPSVEDVEDFKSENSASNLSSTENNKANTSSKLLPKTGYIQRELLIFIGIFLLVLVVMLKNKIKKYIKNERIIKYEIS
ncbi:hypothetical protein [Enterococcus hirae]|uniref:hypothetical protein n=1 Tax=Enterococcus hirae TaxID=1354 RepID=UPI001A9744F4|nr:hypothetical protein [Enterococcus hirae]MBO1103559.1 hypothetical protein [Enterococcus hirae]